MYPAKFDYHRATSLDEAIQLLQQHGEDAKVLAGGHSLIPMMKMRLAQPTMLVDIGRLAELRGFTNTRDGGYRVGAMTTYAEIAARGEGDALSDACAIIGDTQVRNCGTIGGNLAHNDPASDLPAVALALSAQLEVQGPDGGRTIPAEDFIVGLMETALQPNEIVTSIFFPTARPGQSRAGGSAYEKFENPASGYAICGVAAHLLLSPNRKEIERCRVAVTGATDHAMRLSGVEQALEGGEATVEAIEAACENAGEGLSYLSDIHADESYRHHLVGVLARRALKRALERAGGR